MPRGAVPLFLDKSILIRASPERVFEWLAPQRMPRWDASLLRASSEAPFATGARIDRVTRALGFRLESAAEAVTVEPARLFSWRQVAGDYLRHRGMFLLEPVADGTRVRLVEEVELPFVLPRLVTDAEARDALSRDVDAALYNLKDLAEGRALPRRTPVSSAAS